MLKMIVEKQVLLIIAGVFMALGIGSKCVVDATLRKLVYGAGNMNKSTHPFIRLVRAKFEHACMISEKVENVGVFVDKYLYEYRVLGIRLHTLRRMERISAVLCICCGVTGAGLQYVQDGGMTDVVLKTGAIGIGAGIFVFLFHLTTDEKYKLQVARNYMVDYLENICLHRYEKAYRKEKEESQKMKENVDVLTLTATPIPRTLHMSLVGIRDMSVLEEAPEERQPIQTYVMEYNEEMVREAITRELSRNGQVYYVYNRVNTIADMAAKIGEMVPDANVAFAHGQMSERELEKIMFSFINGEIDILVATTIIETGLDISNVNTIIIHDSDRMGLSQLYQLRGRVGRSNRTAYAFLMYKRDKVLREIAEKRLAAIREFTDLGSGFKIAMKDLEIRGAGNLLGERQHGHMEAVGYDLYCKMLNEAVKNLKGEDTAPDFLTTVELEVDAYIPASYIVNEQQKLDIYKRIAGVETESESAEMKEELLDRFGTVPKSVDNLLRIALLRAQAHKLYIMEIKGRPGELRFVYRPDARVHGENIPMLFEQYGNSLKFLPQGNPVFTYQFKRSNVVEKNSEDLLSQAEQMIKDMQRCLL